MNISDRENREDYKRLSVALMRNEPAMDNISCASPCLSEVEERSFQLGLLVLLSILIDKREDVSPSLRLEKSDATEHIAVVRKR